MSVREVRTRRLWRPMVRWMTIISMLNTLSAAPLLAASANGPWGDPSKVSVGIAIQTGLSVSAWDTRGDVTGNDIKWCNAVGDGTYEYGADVLAGGTYNYIFFASATAVNSIYSRMAEPVPNNGSDAGTFLSLSSLTVSIPSNGSVGYGTANGDGRRILTLPDDTILPAGSTIYVYNNFASTPTGVANYSATLIGPTSIKLDWKGALGYWGNGSGALDVLGGKYFLYRSTTASSGPYNLIASLTGDASTYTDSTGLTGGVTAYYVFVASDSYTAPTNAAAKTPWTNLARLAPGQTGFTYDTNQYTYNDKSIKPSGGTVRVIFKVENIDEEYVLKHDSIVYLTPWEEDGRVYPHKTPGTFMRVYVPKS